MTSQPIIARFHIDYGTFQLAADLCLPGSGITVLFGHSGSGKTTLLRCVAGLLQAPKGFLKVNGSVWQDSENDVFIPTHKRSLGYVFQEANLFPHLSVTGNLQFGLKRIGKPSSTADLEQIIDLLGIRHLLTRFPDNLSGGERQRVAIARALALNPDVLLMDEPLASLDFKRKREIMPYLQKLHQQTNIPILYVTHSRDELERLADYVAVIYEGCISASGTLSEMMPQIDQHYS